MTNGIFRNYNEVKRILNEKGYKLITLEEGENKIVHIEDREKYKYKVGFSSLISRSFGIRIVSINNPYSLENISVWLKQNRPEFRLCNNNIYEGNKKTLNFYHTYCKENFRMNWNDIFSGIGCPICSGHQVGKYNSLAYKFPELAKEWHPTKNGKITPNNVSYGSHKKVWWLCPKEHEYSSCIYGRVAGNRCKQCSDLQRESFIATEVKQWCKNTFKNVDIEHKMFIGERKQWLRCDVYLGEKNSINGAYIEINGKQHYMFTSHYHKEKEEFEKALNRDRLKKKYAKIHGLYIEIDLRKIKTVQDAIEYIKTSLHQTPL